MRTDTVPSLQLLFPGVTHRMGRHIVYSDAILEWKDTGIIIIDEISFVSYEELRKLDRNMRSLTEDQSKAHGNVHIVFSGDCSQLKPITTTPFYVLPATISSIRAPGNVHLRVPCESAVERESRGKIHLHIIVWAIDEVPHDSLFSMVRD
jgi:hypothetical protein